MLLTINRYCKNKKLDEIVLCIKSNVNKSDFELANVATLTNVPCVIAIGSSHTDEYELQADYLSRLLLHSFLDMILATFAIHPQFSGSLKHLDIPFQEALYDLNQQLTKIIPVNTNQQKITKNIMQILLEKQDYEEKRQYAIQKGCALENPSLLFLNHIFCDMLAKHINL